MIRAAVSSVFAAIALVTPAYAAADGKLAGIIDRYSSWVLDNDVYIRMSTGMNISKLPRITIVQVREDQLFAQQLKKKLATIAPQSLSLDDQISREILTLMLDRQIAAPQINACSFGATPYGSVFQVARDGLRGFAISSDADADRYVRLVAGLPAFVATMKANLIRNAQSGMRLPRAYIDFTAKPFADIAREEKKSPFWLGPDRLTKLKPAKAIKTSRAVETLILKEVNPALRAFSDFVRGPYAAKATDAIGMGQTPACALAYRQLVRFETTTDMTPEDIHQLGLAQVAAIKAKMAEIQKGLGFNGTPAAFWASMNSKTEFHATDKTDVANRMQAYADYLAAQLPRVFETEVRARGVARAISQEREGGETFGYYALPTNQEPEGIYWFNGANEIKVVNITHEGLIAHELYPGHHYQMVLTAENETLSAFRKSYMPSAYSEGWAEYAARVVAPELGALRNPYNLYGSLSDELFLATRLVVDTGMNAKGWSLAKARAFMRDNTFKTDEQIATESLRYGSAIPAQALGYRIGHILLLKVRKRMEAEMGSSFDIKRFHTAVLSHGALPMSILEKVVRTEMSNPSH